MNDKHNIQNFEQHNFYDLVSNMGQPKLNQILLTYLDDFVFSQHFSIIKMVDSAPKILSYGTKDIGRGVLLACARDYTKQYFAHDELLKQLTEQSQKLQQASDGLQLAEKIDSRAYKRDIFDRHDLIQRLSGVYHDEHNHPILFNLYRQTQQGFYSDLELENFQRLFPVLAKLLQGHFAILEQKKPNDLRQALLLQQPLLTQQEVEVCLRILKGMSYIGIATDLGLKEPTVKTYRNRAFEKLGINFKNQLFAMFL